MKHNRGKIKALPKSIMGKFKSIIGSSLVATVFVVCVARPSPGNCKLEGGAWERARLVWQRFKVTGY